MGRLVKAEDVLTDLYPSCNEGWGSSESNSYTFTEPYKSVVANINITDSNYNKDDVSGLNIYARFVDCGDDAKIQLTYNNERYFITASPVDAWAPVSDGSVLKYYDIPVNMKRETPSLYMTAHSGSKAGTVYVELAFRKGLTGSAEPATTETTGTVRPPATSAISIVEETIIDDSTGAILAAAGDIDVKIGAGLEKSETGELLVNLGLGFAPDEETGKIEINLGDGLQVNDKGEICTTSELSGTNWESLDRYEDGFVVNGIYKFQRQEDGSLLYVNANRVISITSNSGSLPSTS